MTYTPPTSVEFAYLLLRWRLSQTKAAKVLNVDPMTVHRYASHNSEQTAPFANLYLLAAEFDGVLISQAYWRSDLNLVEDRKY